MWPKQFNAETFCRKMDPFRTGGSLSGFIEFIVLLVFVVLLGFRSNHVFELSTQQTQVTQVTQETQVTF